MKNTIYIATLTTLLAACGSEVSEIDTKKEELNSYRTQLGELKMKIAATEAELIVLDPTYGKKENNAVLITTVSTKKQPFMHKIEARGSVESRKNVTLSAEMPGKIQSIKVREGQLVSKGQVLVMLNADIIRNNIAELKTQLELASVVFERQENLWEKKIGSEIKFLETKANKEGLERKLASANSQLAQAIIKAPFSGSIDAIPAREGELAQPGMPVIRIVNPDDVYIKSSVSERYIGKFSKGQKADVYFPSQDKRLITTLASVGQVINHQNRTFEVEVNLPKSNFPIKPNQVVVLDLKDYEVNEAILVPTKVVQKDSKGQFVFVIVGNKATKKHIQTGLSYNNQTEVIEGLEVNEQVANEGYRELAEGVMVKVENNSGINAKAEVAAK